ncbi:hypothetical protein [Desulfovibrio ferrophilus]|uniref:hypothetical protein n=1 Tax=Desulfovibrio ferrophilus TaxID=241368 RepID=UPI000F83449D|nr:hypothetical protein [Desulfovibrio ferrophilus]
MMIQFEIKMIRIIMYSALGVAFGSVLYASWKLYSVLTLPAANSLESHFVVGEAIATAITLVFVSLAVFAAIAWMFYRWKTYPKR